MVIKCINKNIVEVNRFIGYGLMVRSLGLGFEVEFLGFEVWELGFEGLGLVV